MAIKLGKIKNGSCMNMLNQNGPLSCTFFNF